MAENRGGEPTVASVGSAGLLSGPGSPRGPLGPSRLSPLHGSLVPAAGSLLPLHRCRSGRASDHAPPEGSRSSGHGRRDCEGPAGGGPFGIGCVMLAVTDGSKPKAIGGEDPRRVDTPDDRAVEHD